MSRTSIISQYANKFVEFCGYNNRVKRSVINLTFKNNLFQAYQMGVYSSEMQIALDAVWYGIHWYVQTGRASAETEKELQSLTGLQIVKLVFKIWADGANTSGDAADWLNKWQGSYLRIINRA